MEDDHYYYFRNDSAEEGISAGDPNLISGSTEQIADIALPDDSVGTGNSGVIAAQEVDPRPDEPLASTSAEVSVANGEHYSMVIPKLCMYM